MDDARVGALGNAVVPEVARRIGLAVMDHEKATRLFQEDLRREPFWMVVACMLVNCTRWSQAEPALAALRSGWPNARALAAADPTDVEPVVRPLGFGRQRSAKLVRFAREWASSPPSSASDVAAMHGCGKYAADSWSIFVDGDRSVEPTDHYLLGYLSRADAEVRDA